MATQSPDVTEATVTTTITQAIDETDSGGVNIYSNHSYYYIALSIPKFTYVAVYLFQKFKIF